MDDSESKRGRTLKRVVEVMSFVFLKSFFFETSFFIFTLLLGDLNRIRSSFVKMTISYGISFMGSLHLVKCFV